MKNFVLKSVIATYVAGIAILCTPKASVAQVDMSLLTEVATSCQEDVFSLEYYQQLGHKEGVNQNHGSADEYLRDCIESRYFYSLTLSKSPWLASTEKMLPGYPGSVAISQIAYVMDPNGKPSYAGYKPLIEHSYFLDCLASQDVDSKECKDPRSFGGLYGTYGLEPRKFNLFTFNFRLRDNFHAYICPSCYVAYNNYPSRTRMVGSFMEWFMKLEPSRRKELMSILGDEQTQRDNRFNMRREARRAWEEYKAIRRRIAEEEKERRRRELFESTTGASVWEAHAKVCPKSARQLHGSYGSTKDFDITFCRSEGSSDKYYDAYYIGKNRTTGKSIIVRSKNGRFINGQYEYIALLKMVRYSNRNEQTNYEYLSKILENKLSRSLKLNPYMS